MAIPDSARNFVEPGMASDVFLRLHLAELPCNVRGVADQIAIAWQFCQVWPDGHIGRQDLRDQPLSAQDIH
jgi:hypothetical protein